jgi:hypothetical protein
MARKLVKSFVLPTQNGSSVLLGRSGDSYQITFKSPVSEGDNKVSETRVEDGFICLTIRLSPQALDAVEVLRGIADEEPAAERLRRERMLTEQALAAIADGEGDAQIIARSTLAALSTARGAR